MAEKKNRHTRRAIAATRKKYAEALDLDSPDNPAVVFDGLDGKEYSFPHPLYMDDEVAEAVDAEQTQKGKAAALLGPAGWDQFTSHADHRAADVMLIFNDIQREAQDYFQNGTPTQSSTS